MNTIHQVIQTNRAYYCLECGKCTAVCPVARHGRAFSPRSLVEEVVTGRGEALLSSSLMWVCLTCRRCTEICPSAVLYSEFIRDLRALARQPGAEAVAVPCSHGEAIQSWARLMINPDLKQNRLDWLTDDLQVAVYGRGESIPEGVDTIYFVGCLPYYDVLFSKLGVQGVEIARSAVRVLNHLGITPILLADERCCGHDQLWEGEMDTFQRLAELNLALLEEVVRETGAKRIVTTCPECARTLAVDYPALVGSHGLEVLHLSQLLAQRAADLQISKAANWQTCTYHDPCRLGRFMGVYEEPRTVLKALGVELVEMERHGKAALCCGTSCWTDCGAVSKAIQVDRLQEARATGAEVLVTACPKCQIHFRCAQDDPHLGQELDIAITDLTVLVAQALG